MVDRCILFADVAGSTRLYEKLGDAEAKHTVERCLKRIAMAVEAFDGRVVKTIGDAVMAEFSSIDACVQAACQMQQRVTDLPPVAGQHLAIRVGFHHGPVLQENDDMFGDAVNVAARMVEIATPGKIIASGSTIDQLPALARQAMREIEPLPVKGKSEPVRICEVLWHDEGDLTLMASTPEATAKSSRAKLVLQLNGSDVTLPSDWDSLILGRDKAAQVLISDPMASRQHARIERRGDKIFLVDQSTNGTWLCFDGESERQLRREEVVLHRGGQISFGHPARTGGDVVHFEVSA